MFSTKGGLYERAQRRFKVQDGKKLFTYSFYDKQKLEAMVRPPCLNAVPILMERQINTSCCQPGLQYTCGNSLKLQSAGIFAPIRY